MAENDEKYLTDMEMITCVVQRGKAELVVSAAMRAGAGGATINFARGTGVREKLGLLGIAIDPEKEVISIVTYKDDTRKIFDAIVYAAHLDTPGMGFAYVTPLSLVAGLPKKSSKKSN